MSRLYAILLFLSGCSPAMAGELDELHATVKITVTWQDVRTKHVGSGIVVQSTDKRALIATCSHLFPPTGGAKTEVESEGRNDKATMVARLDKDYDLAVIAIEGDTGLCPVIVSDEIPEPPAPVFYTGGAMGSPATRHQSQVVDWDASHRVVAINSIVQSGQSGGGLFNAKGELVGICSGYSPFPDRRRAQRSLFGSSRKLKVMLEGISKQEEQ